MTYEQYCALARLHGEQFVNRFFPRSVSALRRSEHEASGLTCHDEELISKAEKMTDWWEVAKLEDMADTDNGRRALHVISTRLYHNEEYSCDAL